MKPLFNAKQIESTDANIGRLLLPSLLGIIVCMGCLTGLTLAWFCAGVSTPTQKIQAANYTMTASTSYQSEGIQHLLELEANSEGGLSVQLPCPAEHTVTLKAGGNAVRGYCNIKIGDKEYYVKELKPSQSIQFTVNISSSDAVWIDVIPHWGTYQTPTDNPPVEITKDSVIEFADTTTDLVNDETSSETTTSEIKIHKVESGEILSTIAAKYGFTADVLAAYNGIENPNLIYEGQVLEIPSADFELPEETTASVPVQTELESSETTSTTQQKETLNTSETQEPSFETPLSGTKESSVSEISTEAESTSVPVESDNESTETLLR